MATLIPTLAARAEFDWLFQQAITPRLRTMQEFAEQEFVIPKGLAKGTLINWDTQPFALRFVREIDTGRWRRTAVVGCVQSGKSTIAFVLPILYYVFECRESVIPFSPTQKVNRDKYNDEIMPAILASRYRHFLPKDGAGSRSGWSEEIRFTNGGVMKFMSGGGGDENRSSYTARCVVGTEIDKMDTAGGTSRETDPVHQIEDRSNSFPEQLRRCHLECTVSVAEGRIWTEYQAGTASYLACPCPRCGGWVTPERGHLAGWEAADSEIEARARAYYACPACGGRLTEAERIEMNRRSVLLHRGQSIDAAGNVVGDPPRTDTFSFRWNAFNNLFWTPGEVAVKEWNARHAASGEEALERELCQFYWAMPYKSPDIDSTPLDPQQVRRRFGERALTKGVVPPDAEKIAMHVDLGQYFCSYTLGAWRAGCRRHWIEYGTFEVPSQSINPKKAILLALRKFRDEIVLEGWAAPDGEFKVPQVVFVDAGNWGDVVYDFCRDKTSGNRFRPAIGYGLSQNSRRFRSYRHPKKTTSEVKLIGEEYYVVWLPEERLFRVDFNADHWKTELFHGLRTPPGEAGAVELYHSSDPNEHLSLAKQYAAERPVEVFTPGVGAELKWVKDKKKNHFLDNAANLLCAFHFLGARLNKTEQPAEPEAPPAAARPFLGPDGRPWLLTDRT